jgi:MFS family permease
MEIYAYSILFIVGVIFGIISIFYISKISEPTMITFKKDIKFFQKLIEPFKDVNYRKLLIFLFLWNFTINLTTPFFTVYMLKKLQLDLLFVVILINISQVINLLFLRIWGRLSDAFSNKSVLGISCPLFLFCIILWIFTSLPNRYLLTIPILFIIHISMGISISGITLSTVNITFKLTPRGKANWYLAIATVINSIALGIAPLIGGLFSDYFERSEFSWTFSWSSPNGNSQFQVLNLQGLDFFFIIAFFIGFLSLYQLALIKEEGEVKNKIFINEVIFEVKRTMKNVFHPGSYQKSFLSPRFFINHHLKKTSKRSKVK